MSATFKAVVWKELQENLKYAAVVLIGMAAVFAYAIPSVGALLRGQGVDLSGIVNALETTTAIGGLLAGLFIGVAQTIVENRGDKWGFLAHRPLSRTTLFWGKATAGILLYAISTGLPVAAALSWTASPGYLPLPFDWRIALLPIANLLCGLVFYFAGLLTGMRDARWFASRALGIAAAFAFLTLQETLATEFWQAIAATAAGLLILGTAAWGTFVAGGQYGVQPGIGRIATGASIGLGIMVVGGIAITLNLDSFMTYEVPLASRYTYAVTNEGVLARMINYGNDQLEVSDPDGLPLEQYRDSTREQLEGTHVLSARLPSGPLATPSFRSAFRFISPLRRASRGNPVGWYYVHRRGLLAAYDSESGKLVGWMGPDGFSVGGARPRPFAGRLKNAAQADADLRLLMFDDAIYRVDLDNHTVETFFQRKPGETLLGAASLRLNESTLAKLGDKAEFDVIATTQRVAVRLRDGTKLVEVPQDARATRYPVLQVSRALRAPGVPVFVWYQSHSGSDGFVSEINSAGTVVKSWTLPSKITVLDYSRLQIAICAAVPLIGLPSEGIIDRIQRTRDDRVWGRREGKPLDSYLTRPARTTYWAVTLLSSLICAAAAFLLGRMYAFLPGRLITWTGIALLLGPLGFLMMLALTEWPARESCPACSRKRVVTRERCEHCGEPFAAPLQNGTEILEPIPIPHA